MQLQLESDFLSQIIKTQQTLGQKIFTEPGELNIVYIEGADLDGSVNNDAMNEWNDVRLVYRIQQSGIPELLGKWKATSEPGWKYTLAPLNPGGAFRIAFGQYKAWSVGWHKDHEALVQVGEIKGHRDRNKDGFRTSDQVVTGSGYGVNQHWGYDMSLVNGASAGCLVGQSKSGHREFMKIVKTDARYLANKDYVYWTAVLDGSKLEP